MKILNLGCGNSKYGDVRVDMMKTPTTTHVFNVNKGNFPFKDEFFDEIHMEQILEHLTNLGLVIDECHRVLKKGGRVWLRTDHAGFIFYHILKRYEHNYLLKRWYGGDAFSHVQGDDAHYHLFVESHLRKLFKGFKEVKIGYFYKRPNLLVQNILKLIPLRLGASQIELQAIK